MIKDIILTMLTWSCFEPSAGHKVCVASYDNYVITHDVKMDVITICPDLDKGVKSMKCETLK